MIVIAHPPPPAPVSFVQPMPAWSIRARIRSSLGCETPRETRRPWLTVMSSPRCFRASGSSGSKSSFVMRSWAERVTLSMASRMSSAISGCDVRRFSTFASSIFVERLWRVFTRRRGSSGKSRRGLTIGGLE